MSCIRVVKNLRQIGGHGREGSLFTGVTPNQVRNSQTSRFGSVSGQNSGKSSPHSKNDYVAANVVRNVVLRYICYK